MTREEALDEYHAALTGHDLSDPKTKERVRQAREGLMPFLERSGNRRFSQSALPMDLIERFKAK